MSERYRGLLLLLALCSACSAPRDTDSPDESGVAKPSGGSGGHRSGAAGAAAALGGEDGPTSAQAGTAGAVGGSGSLGGAANLGGAGNGSSSAGETSGPPPEACGFSHKKLIEVSNSQDLVSALRSAAPGTMIRLADGEFSGAFSSDRSGDAQAPIVLCGSRMAVLKANASSTVFGLKGDHWVLSGFRVTGGQKGILLDGANHNLLTGLQVHGIGNEAVHFRTHSADNVLEWSELFDTGNESAEFGEGVYIGSAASQWAKFTGSADTPDRSDRNIVRHNKLGPDIRAEHIDIKEGTTGGLVQSNTFDGAGIVSGGYADSWVDVKGNDYSLLDNTGSGSPADGFQVHDVEDGWGNGNVFRRNQAKVNASGYGFRISGSASGTIVGCDNVVSGAGSGLSNIACRK